MDTILIKEVTLINEGTQTLTDIYIQDGIFHAIKPNLLFIADYVIQARGLYAFPGLIDDQVHFRQPGLTHKADIFTESRAAVAGGITTYMEMPNTRPATTTHDLLEQKFEIARRTSAANYSFYLGATADNLDALISVNPQTVCGIKIFMGSSTGDLLVADPVALENIFSQVSVLIATHCEDETTIKTNEAAYRQLYGENVPVHLHPNIRSREACFKSSSFAVELAQKYNTRLHILHISTAEELALFQNQIPLHQKRITAEVCIHHLWFTDQDYHRLGTSIKWNPAIKSLADQKALIQGLQQNLLDVIATDHAPHTRTEKNNTYFNAPSGAPLVQHALPMLFTLFQKEQIPLTLIAEKTAHAPAICFQIDKRGFVREGYHADLVLLNPKQPFEVTPDSLLYKCGWSPIENTTLSATVVATIVSGQWVYDGKKFDNKVGKRLRFNRK
jgi:dihydroorotase